MRLGVAKFEYRCLARTARIKTDAMQKISLCGAMGDHIFELIKSSGQFYEIDLLDRIRVALGPRVSTIVDVGANIGNHTVYFAKIMHASVISIEPNPVVLECLNRNLTANDIVQRVTVVAAGASDVSGKANLISGPSSNLGETYLTQGDPGLCEVPVKTLDEIVTSVVGAVDIRISAIKIDVEGFEDRVLNGGLSTIRRHQPLLIIEAESIERRRKIDDILLGAGYYRLGPFCATPTYVYTFGVLDTARVVIAWRYTRLLRGIGWVLRKSRNHNEEE